MAHGVDTESMVVSKISKRSVIRFNEEPKRDRLIDWMQSLAGGEIVQYGTQSKQGPNYKKILRLSYDVIITYDNRKR